jgi:hypothetical protein
MVQVSVPQRTKKLWGGKAIVHEQISKNYGRAGNFTGLNLADFVLRFAHFLQDSCDAQTWQM